MDKVAMLSDAKELVDTAVTHLAILQRFGAPDQVMVVATGVVSMSMSLAVIAEATLEANAIQAELLAVQKEQLALMRANIGTP